MKAICDIPNLIALSRVDDGCVFLSLFLDTEYSEKDYNICCSVWSSSSYRISTSTGNDSFDSAVIGHPKRPCPNVIIIVIIVIITKRI